MALITEESLKSEWVNREISAALIGSYKNYFPIIPVIINNTRPHDSLKHIHSIHANDNNIASLQKEIYDLFSRELLPMRKEWHLFNKKYSTEHDCIKFLERISQAELRRRICAKADLTKISSVWHDVFAEDMDNHAPNLPLPSITIKLIDKARQADLLDSLFEALCFVIKNIHK